MKNRFALVFCTFIVMSCTSISKLGIGGKQENIMNSSWILDDSSTNRSITLDIKNNKMSGFAGCNNYFSNDLVLNNQTGTIKINSIGSTRAACPDLSKENNFLQLLDKTTYYVIKENKMEMYAGQILILRFTKKP